MRSRAARGTFSDRTIDGGGHEHDADAIRRDMRRAVDRVIVELLRAKDAPFDPEADAPTPDEIQQLADLAVTADAQAVSSFLDERRRDGRGDGWLVVELIPAVAHHLGQQWEDDRRSFTDVTIGVGMLQTLLRQVAAEGLPASRRQGLVVLTCPPAEQHALGIFTLGAWLGARGWPAHAQPCMHADELLTMMDEEPVVAVGLSVSNAELVDEVASLCRQLRGVSPDVGLLLGGAADLSVVAEDHDAVHCRHARDAAAWLARSRRREPLGDPR